MEITGLVHNSSFMHIIALPRGFLANMAYLNWGTGESEKNDKISLGTREHNTVLGMKKLEKSFWVQGNTSNF